MTRVSVRCSTCAWNAAPARPSAPSAWTWRGSRASSSPTTGAATARPSVPTCSDTSTACRAGAAVSRRCRTAIARSGPVRWLNERLLGMDRRRVPPAWTATSFETRFRRHRRQRPAAMRHDSVSATVALFNDTFTNYYSPGIGLAGVEVLERAGFDVELAPLACCGRPLISQGLLAAARRQAESSVERLYPLAERGRADRVLRAQLSFGDSRGRPVAAPGRAAAPGPARGRARGALRRIPGERMPGGTRAARSGPGAVADRPARALSSEGHGPAWRRPRRCSAGYPARRWSISMPAVAAWPDPSAMRANISTCRVPSESGGCCRPRGASADGAVLVAGGTSCRHQVADFTGVRALHPAELIRSIIRDERRA